MNVPPPESAADKDTAVDKGGDNKGKEEKKENFEDVSRLIHNLASKCIHG